MNKRSILEKIVAFKKKELKKKKKKLPLKDIKIKLLKKRFDRRDFKKSIAGKKLALIAEIKQVSPSEGLIRKNFNIKNIVDEYNKSDVNAISVLTDKRFFNGDLKNLYMVRKSTKIPLLRKDFIFDKYQIYESKLYGADAILLIASVLGKDKIDDFLKISKSIGLDCLVEVHDTNELEKVLNTKSEIIGINNRNLKNFKMDLNNTINLSKKIPKNKVIVSESGIYNRRDIIKLKNKVNAVLVGTALMQSSNIRGKINELFRPKIKICGITNKEDALRACNLGADYIGFIFYDKSPRYITKEKAKNIIKVLPKNIQKVGVFVNEDIKKIKSISNYCSLDLMQLSGNESESYCKKLEKIVKSKIVKAIHIRNKNDQNKVKGYNVDYFLFDTYHKDFFGGTGKKFNYNLIDLNKDNIFLAGGLNPKNVVKAIKDVGPYAVDINSGIEKRPGKKDYLKMKLLFKRIKNEI